MHFTGVVFAFHEDALSALLKTRADVLEEHDWPADPESFIKRVANEWAPEKTALFDVVADSFGDPAHPGRTDIAVPDDDPNYDPNYLGQLRALEERMKFERLQQSSDPAAENAASRHHKI